MRVLRHISNKACLGKAVHCALMSPLACPPNIVQRNRNNKRLLHEAPWRATIGSLIFCLESIRCPQMSIHRSIASALTNLCRRVRSPTRAARVPMQRQHDTASSRSRCKKRPTHDAARNLRRHCPRTSDMKRGWTRERGTPPNVQTWICGAYDEEVVAADANLSAPADFQHAQDQLALAKQYPEHARSLPSARVIKIDAGKL
jgi:hypothetical protein